MFDQHFYISLQRERENGSEREKERALPVM